MLTALRTNQSRRSCCCIDGKLRFHCVPNVTFPKTDLRVWADLGSDAGAAEVGAVGDWTPRCNFFCGYRIMSTGVKVTLDSRRISSLLLEGLQRKRKDPVW